VNVSPRLITEDLLLERLTDVFRSVGFDGASLNDLAAATGLQKSSLYHRFPGGKEQMATEVIERLGNNSVTGALASLDADGPIRERVEQVGRALTVFYEAGAKSCLLDTMSVGDTGSDISSALAAAASGWITAFERVAASTGVHPSVAMARAQDAIAAIEGALVLARVTNDRRPFARAIERLPDSLLGTETTTETLVKEH
jgi:TetR/AcrR family transcriptional regulator, lmrAB and yxaGH operons repressor